MATENCLRCSAYLHAKNRPVSGIDLCSECLGAKPPPHTVSGLVAFKPPPGALRGSVRTVASAAALLGVLGAAIGSFGVIGGDRLGSAGTLGIMGAVLGALFGGSRVERAAMRRNHAAWRDAVLEKHEVKGLDLSGLGVVVWKAWPSDLIQEKDIGPLAETGSGFVFLGTRGTRTAVAFTNVASVEVVRDFESFFPYAWVVRLDMADGSHRSIEALHAPHREWARSAAERIRGHLGSSS